MIYWEMGMGWDRKGGEQHRGSNFRTRERKKEHDSILK